jgi:copper chaperone CopZ
MKQIFLMAALAISIAACKSKQTTKENAAPVMVEANLKIEGMTCDDCEASIAKGVKALAGIDSISANHEDSTAFVRFDSNKTDLTKITVAIEERGFEVAKK